MDDACFVEQVVGGEHDFRAGVGGVIVGAGHELDAHRLDIGCSGFGSGVVGEATGVAGIVDEIGFHVTEAYVGVLDNLDCVVDFGVGQLGDGVDFDEVSDCGDGEGAVDLHG